MAILNYMAVANSKQSKRRHFFITRHFKRVYGPFKISSLFCIIPLFKLSQTSGQIARLSLHIYGRAGEPLWWGTTTQSTDFCAQRYNILSIKKRTSCVEKRLFKIPFGFDLLLFIEDKVISNFL